jgi:DNA-binding transcriptional MocR family regulator
MRPPSADVVAVPLDEDGVDPHDVRARLIELDRRGPRPKLVYTIVALHSPLGVTP